MIKFIKRGYGIITVIVNLFTLTQIFRTTHFRIPDLFESAWFWLFIIVSISAVVLLAFFKVQEFIQKIDQERKASVAEVNQEKQNLAAYKQRISDEFCKRMAEEGNLHKRCNELVWRIDDLEAKLEAMQKNILVHQPN
jgi:hypothetical protein